MRRNGFQSTRISRTRGALAYYFCPTLLLQEKRESLACRECRRRHDHCYRPGKSRRRAGSPDRSKNYALSIYEFRDFLVGSQEVTGYERHSVGVATTILTQIQNQGLRIRYQLKSAFEFSFRIRKTGEAVYAEVCETS